MIKLGSVNDPHSVIDLIKVLIFIPDITVEGCSITAAGNPIKPFFIPFVVPQPTLLWLQVPNLG